MKKWLTLVLLGAFLATAMVGCGKDKDADANGDGNGDGNGEPAKT